MRQKIIHWISNHDHVRQSPCMNDVLKINGESTPKKIIEISISDLHKDLATSGMDGILDKNNNIVIGETSLRALIQKEMPYLKKVTTKHMEMCGCITCIVTNNVHRSLNFFRKQKVINLEKQFQKEKALSRQAEEEDTLSNVQLTQKKLFLRKTKNNLEEYKNFAFPNGTPRHSKPSDALIEMMCTKVKNNGFENFHWKCVLGKCNNCPGLTTNKFECSKYNSSPDDLINFENYVEYSRCPKHGLLGKGSIKECSQCLIENNLPKISTKHERTKEK